MQARSRCSPTANDAPAPLPSDVPPPIAACPYCATERSPCRLRYPIVHHPRTAAAPGGTRAGSFRSIAISSSGTGEPQVGIAPDQRLEGDLPLDAGQRRAQTDVDPLAEGDVAVGVLPADIKVIGSRRSARGRDWRPARLTATCSPCGDPRVRDLQVLRGDAAADEVDRPPVAQRLLDHILGQTRIRLAAWPIAPGGSAARRRRCRPG